ncbi:MAG: Farnesyltranstransferase [Verrucomicrobiales bacterium]|jgi:octaprenyl-diphosphate synthase|nr:Farnesyltranstransferase [Verrucomicrobiales bacterium]
MFFTESKTGVAPVDGTSSPRAPRQWKELVASVAPFMEQVAKGLAEQVQAFDPEIVSYAHYALTNQGKQIRPALVALSGGAAGRMNDALVTVAVIIEMVHLATLVHDDIVDEAELRRSRPTLAANWGNQISVLLGDCLFAHAISIAASFPTPDVCRAVALATNRVCSGEILQTHNRGNFNNSRASYFKAVEMKTGELFALSCELGASLSGGGVQTAKTLRKYGMALGTAYQIYDDCLDLFGSEVTVGKSLGTDLASGKMTLPLLLVMEQGSSEDRRSLEEMLKNLNCKNSAAIFELLDRYDALTQTRIIIDQYLGEARDALGILQMSESSRTLGSLADFLAQQTEALGV